MAKKVTRQNRTAREGTALVAQRVTAMGHIWQASGGDEDFGIDGQIALVDQARESARNFRIGVQVRATERAWEKETERGFLYRATPSDVEFWLDSNQPVLLVCARPKNREAYWRNVQEWAADPKRRATRLIEFDKKRDLFDEGARHRFFSLVADEGALLEPPGPEPRPESAKASIMPVRFDVDHLSSVAAPSEDTKELFDLGLAAGVPHTDVLLRRNRLWTLGEFEPAYLEAIGAPGVPDRHALEEWALADDRARQHELSELLRRTLLDRLHDELRWNQRARVAYFKLWKQGKRRRLQWTGRGSGRTVVRPRESTKHDGLSGYRHDAAHLTFRRLGDLWWLTVAPTYLFTFDGVKVSSFHADALKKMKRYDGPAAVSQQLRMWEWLLRRERTMQEADEALPTFNLGELASLSIPVTAPEAAWRKPPPDIRDVDDDQISLLPDEERG